MFKRERMLVSMLILSIAALAQCATIATFADPAPDGTMPLFAVDLQNDLIQGGWNDSQMGLDLIHSNGTYSDAFFTMSDLTYTGDLTGGVTGGGTIRFYADGETDMNNTIFEITFDSAFINIQGIGGTNVFSLFADNVEFGGTIVDTAMIGAIDLIDESFSFSFANQTAIGGNAFLNGYKATAAFTSSASPYIPEPATITLLLLGFAALRKR